MSEKKSKVVEVIGTGPAKTNMPDGNIIWKQDIVLENGDRGTVYSKTNIIPAASTGNVLIYTISDKKAIKVIEINPTSAPPVQHTQTTSNPPAFTKSNPSAAGNPIASAYSQAKDIAVALIEKGTAKEATVENAKKFITEIANHIFDEMNKTKLRHDNDIEEMNAIMQAAN